MIPPAVLLRSVHEHAAVDGNMSTRNFTCSSSSTSSRSTTNRSAWREGEQQKHEQQVRRLLVLVEEAIIAAAAAAVTNMNPTSPHQGIVFTPSLHLAHRE